VSSNPSKLHSIKWKPISLRHLGKQLVATVIAANSFLGALEPVQAQPQPLQCPVPTNSISNRANSSYRISSGTRGNLAAANTQSNQANAVSVQTTSNQVNLGGVAGAQALQIETAGVRDSQDNLVAGSAFGSVADEFVAVGLTQTEAKTAAIALATTVSSLPEDATLDRVLNRAREDLMKAVPAKKNVLENLFNSQQGDRFALSLVTELFGSVLTPAGLTATETTQATQAALSVLVASGGKPINQQTLEAAFQAAAAAVPAKSSVIRQRFDTFLSDTQNLESDVNAGEVLNFDFLLTNLGTTAQTVRVVNRDNPNAALTNVVIGPQRQVRLTVAVKLETIPDTGASVGVRLNKNEQTLEVELTGLGAIASVTTTPASSIAECPTLGPPSIEQIVVIVPPTPERPPLVDPLGRVTGCAGELLPDYQGFNVGLYEPDPNDPTGGVRDPVAFTPTGSGTNFEGIEPNIENSNPFFLTTRERGEYNFLLDVARGQLDTGATYILIVNPPDDSIFSERRIRIEIESRIGNLVTYRATALDGRPISATNDETTVEQTIRITDANRIGLILGILNLNTSVCQAQEIQINKTADRAAAEPGDTVIYRLVIRNLSDSPVNNIVVTDDLPLGFQLREDSVRGELDGERVAIAVSGGSDVTFSTSGVTIPPREDLTIAYAVVLTPDALRGSGENSAIVRGQRTEPPLNVIKDGPALFRMQVRPGLLSNSGTIIGRVFEDKNFDGEQQSGEPGIPNAVVFLDDGTRIVTDENGLFSVANVLPGYRTGVIDLSSLPGYTLAPNLYFKERNSQSRLVRLAPGGMARMNFAVTPAFREEEKK
jgi:uncharacterized repeat protein (TIGR01451 family)